MYTVCAMGTAMCIAMCICWAKVTWRSSRQSGATPSDKGKHLGFGKSVWVVLLVLNGVRVALLVLAHLSGLVLVLMPYLCNVASMERPTTDGPFFKKKLQQQHFVVRWLHAPTTRVRTFF